MTLDEAFLLSNVMTKTMNRVWEPVAEDQLDRFDGRLVSHFLDAHLFTPLWYSSAQSIEEIQRHARRVRAAMEAHINMQHAEQMEELKTFGKLPIDAQRHVLNCYDFFITLLTTEQPKEAEALP